MENLHRTRFDHVSAGDVALQGSDSIGSTSIAGTAQWNAHARSRPAMSYQTPRLWLNRVRL